VENIRREIAVGILVTVISAPILIWLTKAVAYLSRDPGVYLDVSARSDPYGSVNFISVRAENSSQYGLDPIHLTIPSAGNLLVAVLRTSDDSVLLAPSGDSVVWTGRLPSKGSIDVGLVTRRTFPGIDPRQMFRADYSATDEHGFSQPRLALVRTASEATVARFKFYGRWVGAFAVLFVLVAIWRWLRARKRPPPKPRQPPEQLAESH
jgi:hypothetical protein